MQFSTIRLDLLYYNLMLINGFATDFRRINVCSSGDAVLRSVPCQYITSSISHQMCSARAHLPARSCRDFVRFPTTLSRGGSSFIELQPPQPPVSGRSLPRITVTMYRFSSEPSMRVERTSKIYARRNQRGIWKCGQLLFTLRCVCSSFVSGDGLVV